MNTQKSALALLILIGLTMGLTLAPTSSLAAQELPIELLLEAETGALKVLKHTFQSGEDGTNFNYITQGGQEILFPYARVKLGAIAAGRHHFYAVYQPLTLETQVTFREDVTINGETFSAGNPMDLKYGFDFWRLSYGYDFAKADNIELVAGLALQFRNASIVFRQQDGALNTSTTNQNLGLVPALYGSFMYRFNSGVELAFEATGIYASSAFFNGADFEFEGSLLDTSLRLGLPLREGVLSYIGLRYIGGSAVGTSEYEDRFWTQATENYTANYLSTLALTAGIQLR